MFSYMFDLINDELSSLIPLKDEKNTYEITKMVIDGQDVKFIFLSRDKLTMRVLHYELDMVGLELIFKKDYIKPYTDKRKCKEEE